MECKCNRCGVSIGTRADKKLIKEIFKKWYHDKEYDFDLCPACRNFFIGIFMLESCDENCGGKKRGK